MRKILIKNITVVNEGKSFVSDLLIEDKYIARIDSSIPKAEGAAEIDGTGKHLIPGIIDDQVHFREPGLTHKADIASESAAAVAGGVTSFMEMPNTNPPTVTIDLLEEKYSIAAKTSIANYSFYLGGSNDNVEEVKKVDPKNICGLKIFMGSSTGDMLVENEDALKQLFTHSPTLIAVHSENDKIISDNLQAHFEKYGEDIPIEAHAEIRNVEACIKSTERAIKLAEESNAHLHVLHISTKEEAELFSSTIPLNEKKLTAEVCAHHLWFDKNDYQTLGTKIKCNPAIKDETHKPALLKALLNNRFDIIGSDHAPHTLDEKQNKYLRAPSGLPLVQHTLNILLQLYHQQKISLEKIVEKMCHAPAELFQIDRRGFIEEGYFADLAIIDLNKKWSVNQNNILYKCGWSPFEEFEFTGRVADTFVNGNHAYSNGKINSTVNGLRMAFNR
ncbi:MAG: dihydroorotase [Ignavibacteriae bacterium]|nr:dihydroorotase [Ignavibacteriota bacterium]NOG99521.1 dihydroorotase [Ignavibacteriota bacterium]